MDADGLMTYDRFDKWISEALRYGAVSAADVARQVGLNQIIRDVTWIMDCRSGISGQETVHVTQPSFSDWFDKMVSSEKDPGSNKRLALPLALNEPIETEIFERVAARKVVTNQVAKDAHRNMDLQHKNDAVSSGNGATMKFSNPIHQVVTPGVDRSDVPAHQVSVLPDATQTATQTTREKQGHAPTMQMQAPPTQTQPTIQVEASSAQPRPTSKAQAVEYTPAVEVKKTASYSSELGSIPAGCIDYRYVEDRGLVESEHEADWRTSGHTVCTLHSSCHQKNSNL